jgi:hypothetical protein
MAECISRLRIVSDRLQSPTNKTPPDVPWRVPSPNPTDNAIGGNVTNTVEELARKKQVMNLVKENSETIPKSKRKEKNQNRKTQPITSQR